MRERDIINSLVKALTPFAEIGADLTNAPCHRELCLVSECARCSAVIAARNAIDAATKSIMVEVFDTIDDRSIKTYWTREARNELGDIYKRSGMIAAIKHIREKTGLGLANSKNTLEEMIEGELFE